MSKTVREEACAYCGSSDNVKVFLTDQGYECRRCVTPNCEFNQQDRTNKKNLTVENNQPQFITCGEFTNILDWNIPKEVCEKYNYKVAEVGGKIMHVAQYNNYQKIRLFHPAKKFYSAGDATNAGFFGDHIEIKNTTNLFLTEGEKDCLSLATIFPEANIRSIKAGAGNQTKNEIYSRREFLEQFQHVWLLFDNDRAGNTAIEECSKQISPGKVKVISLRYKDINEYLKNDDKAGLLDDIAHGHVYVPPSIITPTKARLLESEVPGIPLKWPILNDMVRGMKYGKFWVVLGGAKIGKSLFTKELSKQLLDSDPALKVGVAYLEEPLKDSGLSFIALDNNVPLYLLQENNERLTTAQFDASYNKYIANDRIKFLDASYMSLTSPELLYNLKYMIKGLGYKVIILDHITMVTYDMGGQSGERKDVDMLLKELRKLVHDTNATIIAVCHVKRPVTGLSWEEGREIFMTDARSSGAFEQLCDIMVGLERNTLDKANAHKLKLKVLANRTTGKVGYADELHYIENTGRLLEISQVFNNR